MKSAISISIRAPAELVFHLVSNVERWPRLLPHYDRVTVRERHDDGAMTADMVARRPLVPVLGLGLPVAWRSRTWNEPEVLRLRFRHLAGATRGMDVTWRIEAAPGGCMVTIEHDFRPRLATWAVLVERAFVRPIAGRTLATFKAIAEATAEATGVSAS
jgi:ribosome-associated toxin RatA of RatAB toxin-antitoxin module